MLRKNYLHGNKAKLLWQLRRQCWGSSVHLYRRKIKSASFAKPWRPIVKKMPTFFIWTTPKQFPAAIFAVGRCSWAFIAKAVNHARSVIIPYFKVVAALLVNTEDMSHFNDSLDKRSLPAISLRLDHAGRLFLGTVCACHASSIWRCWNYSMATKNRYSLRGLCRGRLKQRIEITQRCLGLSGPY